MISSNESNNFMSSTMSDNINFSLIRSSENKSLYSGKILMSPS